MTDFDFKEVKSEIRVLGFDDGHFDHSDDETCLVGVLMRGGEWMEGVMVDDVVVDGENVTSRIVEMIERSKHREQVRVVMTSGITFGGFNVLDIDRFYELTGIPLIVVSRDRPDMDSIKEAVKNVSNWEDRWDKLSSAGDVVPIEKVGLEDRRSTCFVQFRGLEFEVVEELVRLVSTRSSVPEPLRLAHMIATGISKGESVGRV